MPSKISLVYVTTKNRAEARRIAKILLREKLIGCANIVPKIESHYVWKGRLVATTESLLLLKTAKSMVKSVMKRILEIHSFICPCIVEIDVRSAAPAFNHWILKSIL